MSFVTRQFIAQSSARICSRMASTSASTPVAAPVMEGVFAINKPAGISSAQVVREVKSAFTKSDYFKPWLKEEQQRRVQEGKNQRMRRNDRHKKVEIKVGHGGTLDPGATGCLVIGIGKGTKQLNSFIESRKSYEATILFGAATDSYDSFGKILAKAPYEHITKEQVESALERFRGDIQQQPPIFSALKMDGKALYEYARAGKEPPREIAMRPAKVYRLEMTDWLAPGSHEFKWPAEVAPKELVDVGKTILQLDGTAEVESSAEGSKRKRSESPQSTEPRKEQKSNSDPTTEGSALANPGSAPAGGQAASSEQTETDPVSNPVQQREEDSETPPAAKLSMDVGSGFYVRSLCHDLGKAVGSLGLMASLVRTKQGPFALEVNVLAYEDLMAGEETWKPKVQAALEDWKDNVSKSELVEK